MDRSNKTTIPDEPIDVFIKGCREGLPIVVGSYLTELTVTRRQEVLLKQYTDERDQIFSPLLLAIKRGHVSIVKLFLMYFSMDPNDTCHVGSLVFDNTMVAGVTPLWCAAATANFDMVRLLIDHNAEINDCTSTSSSPLRAACFCGNLQIVQYLIEKGADINIPNIHMNTCLMVSSYRGHLEVVEHLLDKGADPNTQDGSGCTALHFAVEGSQLSIAKEIVHRGGDISITNENGMSAPFTAADNCNCEMVDFFCNVQSVPMSFQIALLELLGASFANDKDRYDIGKTYEYFYLAMAMRESENVPKQTLPPVEAYLNRQECQTQEEVLEMRGDLDALHMEALIVRERILGIDNVEVPHPIIYRGAVYADGLQFSRGIALWQRAMDLKQKNNREAVSDLYRFAEVLSQMVLHREEIDIHSLTIILESCLLEATRRREDLERVKASEDDRKLVEMTRHQYCPHKKMSREDAVDSLTTAFEGTIHIMLYLMLVTTKAAKIKENLHRCARILHRFVKLDFRDRHGNTPLHMVLDESTPVDEFHVKDVCSFPNSDICRLLLRCGADANATNNNGNTPLHLIVQYAKPISDFMTLHQAITDLLESGAHPDTRNHDRKSPLNLATTGVAEIILKKESTWSLKCFAARAIQSHGIPYVGHVPVSLEKFIEMH